MNDTASARVGTIRPVNTTSWPTPAKPALPATSGAVLMEAVIALAILATVTISLLQLVGQSSSTVERVIRSEQEQLRADRFLRAATLWSRGELNQRLGVRRQGDWLLSVQRPARDVYQFTLMDSLGMDTLLATAVFRAEPEPVEPQGDRAPGPAPEPPDRRAR